MGNLQSIITPRRNGKAHHGRNNFSVLLTVAALLLFFLFFAWRSRNTRLDVFNQQDTGRIDTDRILMTNKLVGGNKYNQEQLKNAPSSLKDLNRRPGRDDGDAATLDKTIQQEVRAPIKGLPSFFDPEAYLQYHPDLALEGIITEEDAAAHYIARGRKQGRLARRTRVIIRYIACTGLINQHYSHIAAFSLAATLGAELILPPAVCRDSFGHYFSVFKEKNEVLWSPVPLDSLLDVDHIIKWWGERGMAVHRAPSLTPFPDLSQPELAFVQYSQPELDPSLITRLYDVYLKAMDMGELISVAREQIVGHAAGLLRSNPDYDIPYIVLDLPCTFFALRSVSALRVVSEVARSLEFPLNLHAMAQRIIDGMTKQGQLQYNGAHLRVEKDAKDWAMIMGGQQIVWFGYIKTMRETGFDEKDILYVASGLMTYGANADMSRTVDYLKLMEVASEVHHKERYIPREELERMLLFVPED
jgi:hypothetical protein